MIFREFQFSLNMTGYCMSSGPTGTDAIYLPSGFIICDMPRDPIQKFKLKRIYMVNKALTLNKYFPSVGSVWSACGIQFNNFFHF